MTKTPEQRAQDIMDQACLPMGLYVNGVVAAVQADIVKAIKEAIEEAEEAAFARGQVSGASPYDGTWPD